METAIGAVPDPDRLVAVRQLLRTAGRANPILDRLTDLAAQLVEAPISLLTVVSSDRQYFLSSFGLPDAIRQQGQTDIAYSICQYAVATGRPLVVADAHADPLLRGNAAVIELGVIAYAGMPLTTPDGHTVGTLCVLDTVVRDWTDDQLLALSRLADIAIHQIRGRLPVRAGERGEWHGVDSRWWYA